MDIVAGYRAFLHVSNRGSFTLGAAAAMIPQPVASRRIAALESQLGARLLDRTGRRVTLTQFGRAMVPSAERLVQLVDAMELEAEAARLAPLRIAVPDFCAVAELAVLVAGARSVDLHLEVRPAARAQRAELARLQQVEVSVAVVTRDIARWVLPLGLAGRRLSNPGPVYLESLRPNRGGRSTERRRVWVQPEDDVAHVADHLRRLADATGLSPSQIVVAPSLVGAAGSVLGSADLLLCSPRQAQDLQLDWRPLGEDTFTRNYALVGAPDVLHRVLAAAEGAVADCLGVMPAPSVGAL